MNSLVMWVGALLVAVLVTLFAVPMFIDWNGYRGVFEEQVSRVLGRDVRVGGSVNLRLLPTPYLRFEKLRVADTSGGTGEPLFRAETFTLWLSVPPLLRGDIEVRHMELDKPVLNLSVDGGGVGNWASLSLRSERLPFVPQNVALQSVGIADGSVVFRGASANEILRLDAIAGELAADALNGPYRFAGSADWDGTAREMRLATGKAGSDGELRFKASVRPKATAGVIAQFDGSVRDLQGRARLEAALGLVVPLPELPAAASAADAPPRAVATPKADGTAAKPAVSLDIKGKLAADGVRLAATELVASIENVGQPQLLAGDAAIVWGDPPRLEFNVSSHWLDLDRLAPATSGRASPMATVAALTRGLAGILPSAVAVSGVVGVEQLTLGGEAVGGLDIALKRAKGEPLTIDRFIAALPAGARVALDGRLSAAADALDLDGRLTIAGPSLTRLAKWAAAGAAFGNLAPEGAFALDGEFEIDSEAVRLRDARGRLSGHALSGTLSWPFAGAAPLSVAIDAEAIESGWLFEGGLTREALLTWLDRLSARPPGVDAGTATALDRDLSIKIRSASLQGPDRTLEDVDVSISVQSGVLSFERLAFRDGDALTVDLAGRLATTADAPDNGGPGFLYGQVSAATAPAFIDFVAMAGYEVDDRVRRFASLAPLRLATNARIGARLPGSLDARIDGLAGGGRLSVGVSLDSLPGRTLDKTAAAASSWRQAPAEITIAATDAPVVELLALLTGRTAPPNLRADVGQRLRANAALKAVGTPAAAMVVDSVVTAPGLSLAYNGSARVGETGRTDVTGTLEVAADRLGDVLAIAGLTGTGRGLDQALTGTLGMASADDGSLKLTPSGLTIAGARIDGMLRVSGSEQGRTRVDGEISVDQASVGGLLAGLVEGAPRPLPALAPPSATGSSDGTAPIWSDQSFSADAFQRIDGTVKTRIARLALAPGLTVADARLAMTFSPGRIATVLEEAHALGGAYAGEVTLDRAAAGVRVSGKLQANGIALSQIARAAGAGAAEGTAAATLSFSGQALSPRALVTSLEGAGRVTLAGARVTGMSPAAVQAMADAAFKREFTIDEGALLAVLKEALKAGALPLGQREIAVAVDDGALKLERFQSSTPAGRTEALVTVDLATFDAETEWRMTAKSVAAERPDWPAVSVYYTGALSRLSEIEPRIALGTFERELTVRRMEREVEELERLRRLDEERARQERERQQALEAERLRRIEEERQRRLEQQQQQQQQTGALPAGQSWPTSTSGPAAEPSAATAGSAAAGELATPPAIDPLADPAVAAPRPRPARPRPPPAPRDNSSVLFGPPGN